MASSDKMSGSIMRPFVGWAGRRLLTDTEAMEHCIVNAPICRDQARDSSPQTAVPTEVDLRSSSRVLRSTSWPVPTGRRYPQREGFAATGRTTQDDPTSRRWPDIGCGHGVARGGPVIPATINGRPVISRADMAVAFGVSRQSLYLWQRDRAVTGHPTPAGTLGGTTYWYEDEWTSWYRSRQQGKLDGLTRVDRGGDPDDLVDADEAARIMGYAGRAVIHGNVRLGYFPQPDSRQAAARGRPRPLWRRSTVWAAADARTGRAVALRQERRGHPPSPIRTRAIRDWRLSWSCCAQVRRCRRRRWLRSGELASGPPSGLSGLPGTRSRATSLQPSRGQFSRSRRGDRAGPRMSLGQARAQRCA